MLSRLRYSLMNLRNQWRLLNTPVEPQPMFDGFRTPILTREERLEARRQQAQRYLEQHNLIRTQARIQPQP